MLTMKWRSTPTLLMLAILAVASALVLLGILRSGSSTNSALSSRAALAPLATTRSTSTTRVIGELQEHLKQNRNDRTAMVALANAYLQQVRETGDPALYTKVDVLLDEAERLSAPEAEVLATRGTLALARHDFSSALEIGQQALAAGPDNPVYYGIIGDAQIELGMYEQAIASYQQMVDRAPNFSSFARVAHARELYGDPEGAIEALQFAIEAGSVFPENVAWGDVQLGNLWFSMGNLAQAQESYDNALLVTPDYAPALAGQARVAAAQGRLQDAARLYVRASELMPLPEYAIALGDVYHRLGDEARAQSQYDLVVVMDKLFRENGVNTDLEIALFFADHNLSLDDSLEKARAAYQARPSIHAADVLAWTHYRRGEFAEAQRYATEALKLNTRDALKLFHAGMIARALGQNDQARNYLEEAVRLNPHFSLLYSDLAIGTIAEIKAETPATGTGGRP